jgi:hypothetical protein
VRPTKLRHAVGCADSTAASTQAISAVTRGIERVLAGILAADAPADRQEPERNFDGVCDMMVARFTGPPVRSRRIDFCPVVRAAGCTGSARNFRRLVVVSEGRLPPGALSGPPPGGVVARRRRIVSPPSRITSTCAVGPEVGNQRWQHRLFGGRDTDGA